MRASSASSFFLAGPRRDETRVHRHDDVARLDEALDEQAVAGLDHDPDLGGVGLEPGDPGHQGVDRGGAVLHARDIDHTLAGAAQRDQVELLGPIDADSEHIASFRRGEAVRAEARRRADGPVLVGRHPCGRRTSEAVPRGRRLTSVLEGQATEAFPGKTSRGEGRAISDLRRLYHLQALRAFAYGLGSVMLGASLAREGYTGLEVGLVFGSLLAGSALASILLARRADRLGRQRIYLLLLVLMGLAGAVFALADSLALLMLAGLTGTMSVDVVESGPFTSLEQAMIPEVAGPRTAQAFGRYNAVAALVGAAGALAARGPEAPRAALPSLAADRRGSSSTRSSP
jgi:hypothetical protein